MTILAGFILLTLLVGGFLEKMEPPAGDVDVTVISTTGEAITPVTRNFVEPLSEIKQRGIVKQGFDYSCGSAALATLLNSYMGEQLGERQIIDGLLKYGDVNAITRRQAFSMLDMKRFVTNLGYKAGGFKAEISDLEELENPCIVPIRFSGYQHFVVLKAVTGGRAFIADPFQGNLTMGVDEFADMWVDNMLFLVFPRDGAGLTSPRLTEVDLRFIDQDMARNIRNMQPPEFTSSMENATREAMGNFQTYKPN